MTKAFEHITITTGSNRMSPRSEVGDDTIAFLRQALATPRAFAEGWTYHPLPALADGVWVFDLRHSGIAIARCWLCANAQHSDAMWADAAEHTLDERVVLCPPRGVPWLAAALLPGALSAGPEVLMEAGDLERCIAWTLLGDI